MGGVLRFVAKLGDADLLNRITTLLQKLSFCIINQRLGALGRERAKWTKNMVQGVDLRYRTTTFT